MSRWVHGYALERMASDDAGTTISTLNTQRVLSTRPVLAATIAAHPDASRIGEQAVLGPFDAAEADLSRLAPEFFSPSRLAGRPLEDRATSRRSVRVRATSRGIEVRPTDPKARIWVGGETVGESAVASCPAFLRLGRVVLVLNRRTAIARGRKNDHEDELVGCSEALDRVRDHVDRVATEPVTVLLRGESGVGKELVARAIHRASHRRSGPFVALNMAALPPGTAPAELFGHVRGGYTGAVGEHYGAFGAAAGGTLFLDEIGATDEAVQSMLLRTLETGEVRQVGGRVSRPVDVRVIAATDANLETLIQSNRFRLPLFHRLAGYEINIPPLRERREDIGVLAFHFVREALASSGEGHLLDADRDEPWLSASIIERLLLYRWPGNVRELRNVARQIVIGSRGSPQAVLPEGFERFADERVSTVPPAAATAPPAPRSPRERGLDSIGDEEIVAALRTHHWEPTAASRALGISKASMYELMARCPGVRSGKDLTADEIREAARVCSGDLRRMAERLEVSKRALSRRMTDLGMT